MAITEAPIEKIKGQSVLRTLSEPTLYALFFIMYYANANVSNLSPGWYTLKVNGVPVIIQGSNAITKGGASPTVGPVTLQLTLW